MAGGFDLGDLAGGVCVLTGAASGIGYALAEHAARLGMHVCLSDVRGEALEAAVRRLQASAPGAVQVAGFLCDAASRESCEVLRRSVQARFPDSSIKMVCANAGVLYPRSTVLTGTTEEWDFTYKVNVVGVVHTVQAFIPTLLKQDCKSVLEITASVAGISFGSHGPYGTSKLACLGVAEALHNELRTVRGGDRVRMVCLCPALVATGLLHTSSELTKERGDVAAIEGLVDDGTKASANSVNMFKEYMHTIGMTAEHAAEQTFAHLRDGKFYCLLDNEMAGKPTGSTDGMLRRRFASMSRRVILSQRAAESSATAGGRLEGVGGSRL